MKRLFRGMIFETNSSTTHSTVILSDSEYQKWEKGELYIHWNDDSKLYTFEEAYALINKDNSYNYVLGKDNDKIRDLLFEHGYYTSNEWLDDEYLETDWRQYVTEHGDKIVVCCKYGRDD